MQNLQKEFDDLSVSLLKDITKTCDNDPKKAAEMLRALKQEEKREKDKKVDELHKQFDILPREVIAATLAEYNYDDDAVLIPLFNKVDEFKRQQEQEAKKKRQQDDKKRREEVLKQQIQYLMDIFQGIPSDVIQQYLDDNEGDLQETTNQLLVVVQQKEEEERKEADKRRKVLEAEQQKEEDAKARNLKFEVLKEKFPELSYNEVISALESHGWDIKASCKYLVNYSVQKKFQEIRVHFTDFSDDEIHANLQGNNWDTVATIKTLTQLRDARRREDEEKRRMLEKEAQLSINVTKIQQSILERSIIIGNEVERTIIKEEEIQRKLREEEAREQFKQELGKILTVQCQNGAMPGLVPPPLPKEIDALLGKKKPFEEDEAPIVTVETENRPSPVSVSQERLPTSEEKKGIQAILKASPETVDCGNTITVNWEVVSGTSTAYDWIGFYQVGQPNKQYITYDWRGKQENKGSLTFTAPSTYGVYEFRYFPSSCYEHVTMSNQVIVGPQIDLQASLDKDAKKFKVTWNKKSGNDYSRSWIGLFEKSKPNKEYIAWEYASKGSELTFDAPVKPVEYEFRFFAYSYIDVSHSNTITIEGEDKISASWENGKVVVKVNIVTVDPQLDGAWVGLFFVDQQDNRQWRRYKYVKDRSADLVFDKPPRTGGVYEARLFANKTYQSLVKSNQFSIPDQK